MNDFEQAFSDVLEAEKSRKPVWVVGIRCEGWLSLWRAPFRGIVEGELPDGRLRIRVPSIAGNEWLRPKCEVFDSESDCIAHIDKILERERDVLAAIATVQPMYKVAERATTFYMGYVDGEHDPNTTTRRD